MKTENLIEIMDSVGTRNIYRAYKAAYLGKGKPDNCPDKLWENIKIWENFNEVNDADKSVFELDKETAEHQIKENQSGMKQKYLQDSLKLAKDHDKLVGGSKEAKKDVEIAKQRIKDSQTGADMDYLKAKKDLATKYEEDYQKSTENMSEDKRKNMEISQKDFNKLMAAMNTLNKHFSEEEEEVKDEVVESETENEDVDSEAEAETEDEEDTETIELPADVADAIREALDEADDSEDDEDESEDEEVEEEPVDEEEEEIEEDEEEAEEDFEDEDEVDEEEEDESEVEEFSEKFYKFSETITETIENLDKKADKLADQIQDKADEKVIEFSKKDFIKFAESITTTIETLADRLNAIEIPPKNEITKDLSNLEQTADDYEEEFVTKSDEVAAPCPNCGKDPCECATETPVVADETPANFSKRYEGVKNFLTRM